MNYVFLVIVFLLGMTISNGAAAFILGMYFGKRKGE